MVAVKAVLFDLDGTLVDSLPELYEGVRRSLEELGFPVPEKEAVRDMIGRGVSVLVDRLRSHLQLTDAELTHAALLSLLVKHWAQTNGSYTTFYPGVLDGIAALRAADIRVGLVTNKWRDLTMEFLQARGIRELFDVVVAGDDCPHNKPAPDMLLKAIETLKVDAAQTIMVGDSRNDALAARAAGIRVALVETGYNEGEAIALWAREAGFNRCLPSAKKVCDLVLAGQFQ